MTLPSGELSNRMLYAVIYPNQKHTPSSTHIKADEIAQKLLLCSTSERWNQGQAEIDQRNAIGTILNDRKPCSVE